MKNKKLMMVALLVSSSTSLQAANSEDKRVLGSLVAYNEKCEGANSYGIDELGSMSEATGYSIPSELFADADFSLGFDAVKQIGCEDSKVIIKKWGYYKFFKDPFYEMYKKQQALKRTDGGNHKNDLMERLIGDEPGYNIQHNTVDTEIIDRIRRIKK